MSSDLEQAIAVSEQYESRVRYYSRHFPDIFSHALGSKLYNIADRSYIDFFSGAGTLNYGHNNPKLKQAIIDYIADDGIIHGLDMYTPAHTEFLLKFQEIILQPRNFNYKIQFTGPTGTNAVEAALKLARKYTRRKKIVYCKGSYHGVSLGALSVSDSKKRRENIIIDLPYTVIIPYSTIGLDKHLLTDLKKALSALPENELPAALILETIQGEGGVNIANTEWLQGVGDICQSLGILLIVDDVQMGCGRTGKFFSFEAAGIVPDIVCLSKSLSGYGLPFSLVLMKPHLDVWDPGEHSGTFRCNNLSLVSANKALDFWHDKAFLSDLTRKTMLLASRLQALVQQYPGKELKHKGVGFVHGLEWSDDQIARRVSQRAFSEGLIVETSGKSNQTLKLMPALTISDEELIEGIDILDRSISELYKE